MTNKIATAIDRNKVTAGVFVDLSKAFDTLNHQILFSKQKKLKTIMIPLVFDGDQLMQKRVVKLLGVFIDENLSWKFHVNYICKKSPNPLE